jgi:aldehyde:ferredoxin oxidoreductase
MLKVVRVDMGSKDIRMETNNEYLLLGGRALSSRIIYDEVAPECEPLGKRNKLVIAPGLLAGTIASSAGRISVGSKSPLTNGIKEANCGGTAGFKMVKCGIKAVIVEGKSEDSGCYVLKIDRNGIDLIKYDELKYLGTYDTTSKLYEKYGKTVGIMCIGPVGERGLRAAAIASSDPFGELKFAARGGLGAVMGIKGLKAIVVDDEGMDMMEYCDKDEFIRTAKDLNKKLVEDPKTKEVYQRVGTSGIVKAVNAMGALPTRSFRQGSFEYAAELCGEKLFETINCRGGKGKTGIPCMNGCVIRCSNVYPDSNGEKIVSTLQYENIALLGSNLGMNNLDAVARINREINDIGLDTIETGAALGVALDEGLGTFGDEEGCMALLKEIRRNTVLGRVLGNGTSITGRVLGSNRIPAAKNQGFPGYDPRALKGNGVTYAMSTMGADHTAGNCFGARNQVNPLATEGQGELSKGIQIKMATLDSLGFCIFARGPLFADPSILTGLVNSLTGSGFDNDSIWDIGINTLKLEREFNIKAGISPAHDKLPEYLYEEVLEPMNTVFDLSNIEMNISIV